jgi:hypothetical protein
MIYLFLPNKKFHLIYSTALALVSIPNKWEKLFVYIRLITSRNTYLVYKSQNSFKIDNETIGDLFFSIPIHVESQTSQKITERGNFDFRKLWSDVLT